MKNKLLKISFIVFLISLMCAALMLTSQAATTENGLVYSVSDNEVTITGFTGKPTELVIPAEIEDYPVTCIGNSAFARCDSLTSVTIPDSVTHIDDYAFSSCGSLASITIPDSVTSIGEYAFFNCTSLTSVTIPDSVTSIGNSAFSGCNRLASITIPDSVTHIDAYAFAYCYSLASITIPDSVTSIGDSAFAYCHNLASITIPDSVTSIGNSAFAYCYSLASITIPDSVTSIKQSAFNSCKSLTSVTIPDIVTSIGSSAFSGCDNLVSVSFGKNSQLTSIGSYAFSSCKSLASITIPDSVTHIGNSAFSGCGSLVNITIPDSVTSIGDSAFLECTSLTSVTIPDSVTSIGDDAFSSCTSLTSVIIGVSVTSIGNHAFYYCTSLTDITVDADNTAYCSEDGVLFNKSKTELIQYPVGNARTSYTIPDSVTSIGDDAFSGCTSLTSVIIGDSVTTIGEYAFSGCTSLTSVIIGDSVTTIGNSAFSYCTSLTSVSIPDSVTIIGSSAFRDCTSLSEITIPNPDCTIYDSANTISTIYTDTVIRGHDNSTAQAYAEKYDRIFVSLDGDATDIILSGYAGDNADFTITRDGKMTITGSGNMYNYAGNSSRPWSKYCTFIKSVSIANTITSIGSYAFSDCNQLAEITIPDSVTSIGSYAFEDCTSLVNITIPDSVQSIGYNAFENCDSLVNITIPDSVTSINTSTFSRCNSLTSITIPDSVQSIGNNAFSHCDSLASVTFGENSKLTSIDYQAFMYCAGLANITIPYSVKSIDSGAFSACTSLASITILNPKCSIDNYDHTISDTAVIYGYENSTAQSYARQYNRSFVALECDHLQVIETARTEATCIADGSVSIQCKTCGETVTKTLTLNPDNHVGETELRNATDATFDAPGYTGDLYCLSCGEMIAEGTEIELLQLYGDADGDGFMTALDARLALRYVVYLEDLDWEYRQAIDMDNDGFISAADARLILRAVVGLEQLKNAAPVITIAPATGATSSYDSAADVKIESDWVIDEYGTIAVKVYFTDAVALQAWDLLLNYDADMFDFDIKESGADAQAVQRYCNSDKNSFTDESNPSPDGNIRFSGYFKEALWDAEGFLAASNRGQVCNVNSDNFEATIFYLKIVDMDAFNNSGAQIGIAGNLYIDGKVVNVSSVIEKSCKHVNGTESLIPATCVETGERILVCPDCGLIESEILPIDPNNHVEWKAHVITPATCVDEGERYFSCSFCGTASMNESTPIDFNNHASELIIIEGVAPTDRLPGVEESWSCPSCGVRGLAMEIPPLDSIAYGICGENVPWVLKTDGTMYIFGSGDMEDYTIDPPDWYSRNVYDQIETIVIEDGVTSIGDCAFGGCFALRSVTIPDSVVSIGESAFEACASLTDVIFGENSQLTNIGNFAFNWCESLSGIDLPDTVSHIGEHAFNGCYCLTDLTIPDSVTSIVYGTFSNCALENITIPENVESIDARAFAYCYDLNEITILNPSCLLYDEEQTICETATIKGYINSTAQDYAEKYGRRFVVLCLHENTVATGASAPTCTKDGFTGVVTCADCQILLDKGRVIPATGAHTPGSAQESIVTTVTCTKDGLKKITVKCVQCTEILSETTEAIPAHGHDYKTTVSAPTCTRDGYTTYTCAYGDSEYIANHTNAHGHDYTTAVTPPTCTRDGYTTYTCSHGDSEYIANHTAARGHKDADGNGNCDACGTPMSALPDDDNNGNNGNDDNHDNNGTPGVSKQNFFDSLWNFILKLIELLKGIFTF